MSSFKDILIRYLGCDSIERAREMPITDMVFYDCLYQESYGYDVLPQPSITTTCNTPNERFYNWILSGWNIVVVPKMVLNTKEHRFVEVKPTINKEDQELGEEIAFIKSKTQKSEIHNYFRD